MVGTNGQALTELQRRFSVWRGRRSRSRRIPEDLWRDAVHAAREHGVCRTARQLRVDYYSLKRRLTGHVPAAEAEAVEFVEIPRKVFTPTAECVLELHDAKGHRLRVEVRDPSAAEAFARTLWSLRG